MEENKNERDYQISPLHSRECFYELGILIGLLLLGAGGFYGLSQEKFNIVIEESIEKDSYIAYINGEVRIIQQGDEINSRYYNEGCYGLNDDIKLHESKHKHYIDLISKIQYTDSNECYINEIVGNNYTKEDDNGYRYQNIVILDSLDNYLSEYDKILIENGKFSDEDLKVLLQKIQNNEVIINKVRGLGISSSYALRLKSED